LDVSSSESYRPEHPVRTERLRVRGLTYAVHQWGEARLPPLVLLHGWMDTGLGFQFLADALAGRHRLIAPDWRGFGDSDRAPGGYWFPDYLGDLDALLDHYSPRAPVALLGHSMGGNVASLYAGTRPARIRAFITLEAIGLEPRPASEAPARYAQWLDELREPPTLRSFASLETLAAHLQRRAPRLDAARAAFLAGTWSRPGPGGERILKADPMHKVVNPVLYRHEEFLACLGAITAPALLVLGRESWVHERYQRPGVQDELQAALGACELAVVAGSGHMLHHDQPRAVAGIIDEFLSRA